MKIRRKTEIRVQTEKVLIIRNLQPSVFTVCAECGAKMVSPEEAAVIFGKRTRDIYREIENGTLRFTETDNGDLLVCCNFSETREFQNEKEKNNEQNQNIN